MYNKKLLELYSEVIGYVSQPIDATFKTIRSKSTSLSSFIMDIVKCYCGSDIALINSGTIRFDSVIEIGEIT